MSATTTHKDLAKHLRGRIKAEGIPAGCRMVEYCGRQVISIYPRGGVDATFSDEQQRTVRLIAQVNGLTRAEGMPIDLERMTDTHGGRFYL